MIKPEDFKNSEIIKFLKDHENHDPFSLSLNAKIPKGANLNSLVTQIQSKQKAKAKIPEWYATENIIFPVPLSMEQCSSEATAKFKAQLFSGKRFIDMTGGAGIDCHYIAKNFEEGVYIEQNEDLFNTTKYNFNLLANNHIDCINIDSLEYIKGLKSKVDLIYLDPARRSKEKKKVFLLEDCSPNILEIKEKLFQLSANILVKVSPMLDIHLAVKQIEEIKKIWIVSYKNECKELLIQISESAKSTDCHVNCIDIKQNGKIDELNLSYDQLKPQTISFSSPLKYLYEPNSSINKSGAFDYIAKHFSVNKLDQNTHLYTSENFVENFSGKSYKIISINKFDRKEILKALPGKKARIILKNFPHGIDKVKQKLKIKEGGNSYLICTSIEKKLVLVLCEKSENSTV